MVLPASKNAISAPGAELSATLQALEHKDVLPTGLVNRIVEHLQDDLATLLLCRLVSRTWDHSCSALLRTLRVVSQADFDYTQARFADDEHRKRLSFVRTLALSDVRCAGSSALQRFVLQNVTALTNVETLHLSNWAPLASHPTLSLVAFPHLRHVTTLSLLNCAFRSVGEAKRIIRAFRGLRELALQLVYVRLPVKQKDEDSPTTDLPPPELSVLSLTSGCIPPVGSTRDIGFVAPTGSELFTYTLGQWLTKYPDSAAHISSLRLRIHYDTACACELESISNLVKLVGPRVKQCHLEITGKPRSLDPLEQLGLDAVLLSRKGTWVSL